MSTATQSRLPLGSLLSFISSQSKLLTILKYIGLMLVDALGLIIFYTLLRSDNAPLAIVFLIITIVANIIIFVPSLYPLRWMNPGLLLLILLVIYPIVVTVQVSFTNLSDGHRFTKLQSIDLIEERGFVPEGATTYSWIPFRRGEDEFALWLVDDAGETAFALPGEPIRDVETEQFGIAFSDDSDLPQVDGYSLSEDASVVEGVSALEYVEPVGTVRIGTIDLSSRYLFDLEAGMVFDQERGTQYDAYVFESDGSYALWLLNPNDVEEALLAIPGEDVEDIDVTVRDELADFDVRDLNQDRVPAEIGAYTPLTGDITADIANQLADIEDGLRVESVDFSRQYVYDPAQAITLDLASGTDYDTSLYLADAGDGIALWLDGGRRGTFLLRPDAQILFNNIPTEFEGYQQIISNLERTQALQFLELIDVDYFGADEDTVGVINTREAGRPYVQRYVYDAEGDFILDQATDVRYLPNEETGDWVPDSTGADELNPGFQVYIGLENFTNLFQNPALSGPFGLVFIWTFAFALLSVLTTFVVGLAMAIIVDPAKVRFAKLVRSLLIIPYAIPGVISILVWRGLLNENIGLVTTTLESALGVNLPWFSDPLWAKAAVILVNLWLGYPYMMLICTGALQAIPSDIYEAAAVDGARPWDRFSKITLPLLLITVGPLLIASFTYNFNNYLIIEALTQGNPPIPGTPTPAGHTDLLINYTYNLAFGGGRGAELGFASAITIVIFAIVAVITLFNFRLTKQWEEVGENV